MRPLRLLLLSLLMPMAAFSYTHSYTESGHALRWHYGQKLFLAGNPENTAGYSADRFREGVVHALQQWTLATRGLFGFEYWQGNDPTKFETNSNANGLSSLFFASNSKESTDPSVIGFTQVWYNAKNGDLIETDVILNDRNFEFTDRATDSSSHSQTWAGTPRVYLDNILTHELGHAIGMSHSGDLNSSMLFVEFLEQSKLGCDDIFGARHLYGSVHSTEGSLSGTILSPTGEGVAGVQVTAISKSRGMPIASALTDQSGNYYFGNLEVGPVSISVAPYPGSPDSVSARFQTRSQTLCSGSSFPNQFVTKEDGHALKPFLIEPTRLSRAGSFQIRCSELTGSGDLYSNRISPDWLVDVGYLGVPSRYFFESKGDFKITSSGFLLMSPIQATLQAFDASGKAIPLSVEAPVYESESGFIIPDTRVTGSAVGRIEVRVIPTSNAKAPIPYPALKPSTLSFFTLSFSNTLSFENARCLLEGPFLAYPSPSGDPIRYSSTRSGRDLIGFCGTANASSRDHSTRDLPGRPSRSTPHEYSAGSILGWFWPFIVILAFQLNSKLRRARLKASWRSTPSS